MGQILQSIHNVWIASSIVARHTQKGVPRGITHILEKTIVNTLNKSTPRIYVHWGAYESGKSRAASNARFRLQDDHDKLVMLTYGWEFTYMPTAREWLRAWMGVPKDRAQDKLSMFLPANEQTVLIIDHADFLVKQFGEKDVAEAVRELNIPALILFSSWERALDMLKQDQCQLLGEPGLGRWHWRELAQLYASFPEDIKKIADTRKNELRECAVLSGSPGILQFEAYSMTDTKGPNLRRAQLINQEWENGIRALSGEDMQGVTGRFPDKNHTFHWDMA